MAWSAEPHRRPPQPAPTSWRPGFPGWQPAPYFAPGPPPPAPTEPKGLLWASVPFMTFGLGSPISFVYGGARSGSRHLLVAGAGYGLAYLAVFGLWTSGHAGAIALGILLFLSLWVSSSVHAVVVRRLAFPRSGPRDRANAYAIQVAQYRRTLREQARQLLVEDPALAMELCIGRPDLPRGYDDGGLIDVNHAPGPTLALLPGLTDEMIGRILNFRSECGGFISPEELGVAADLPPDVVQRLAEYAIFLP